MTDWSVYIIRCDDGTLYTGISTDVERRFAEHGDRQRGAKYFNGRKPEKVVYVESGHSRSTAGKREVQIKKLNRKQKLLLAKKSEV